MPLTAIAAFWAVSFLLVLTPGADWAYVIAAGLRGRRWVPPAVAGLACGALLATAAVAAGVGALVARHPALLSALTLAGALWLLHLGRLMWRSAGAAAVPAPGAVVDGGARAAAGPVPAVAVVDEHGRGPAPGPCTGHRLLVLGCALKGAGVSGLNPKLLLLLLALLPQFVQPAAAWPVAGQILALGAVHAASCVVVYLGVGLASQRVLGARPTAARTVTRVSGGLMIAIGVGLVGEQVGRWVGG
ncbi:MAG: hypothetical protein RLY78_2779 [Pseudomonadota bacterium]|jgi:threonine/homoserine/homoserine lactone efflux protein